MNADRNSNSMSKNKKLKLQSLVENPALIAAATRLAPSLAASAAGSVLGKKLAQESDKSDKKEKTKKHTVKEFAGVAGAAGKVVGPLMNTLSQMDPEVLSQLLQMLPKLIQMKQSIKVRENKTVKEAVPASPRELAIQQQLEDMKKYFEEDPELAAQVMAQMKSRKKNTMPPPPPVGESKSIQMTKDQLKEVVSKTLEIAKKKKIVKETMLVHIKEQKEVRDLTEKLLNEGPLSNMFRGVAGAAKGAAGQVGQLAGQAAKSAGQAAKQAVGKVGQAGQSVAQAAKAQAVKSMEQGRAADMAKELKTTLSNSFKNASKAKEKFSQEKLKNAGLINQYHDSVVNLTSALEKAKSVLSQPELEKFSQETQNTINNLYYDLTSEKDGIDVFLKTLRDSIPQLAGKTSGANAVKAAKKAADKGPDGRAEPRGGFGRPSMRGTRSF